MRKIMKIAIRGFIVLLFVPVVYFALIYGASELGGEVVTLDRPGPNGEVSQVRMWIVDQDGNSWVEHGDAESYWVRGLAKSPAVILSRGGKRVDYLGKPDRKSHDLYHRLRQEKYAWGSSLIDLLTGGSADCEDLPVQLQPAN
jgi:hypothetical protein